jgi:hypothetical protein
MRAPIAPWGVEDRAPVPLREGGGGAEIRSPHAMRVPVQA